MKIKIFCLVLVILLCSCSYAPQQSKFQENNDTVVTAKFEKSLKGIWISYLELNFDNKSKSFFTEKINKMFLDIKTKGFNAIFVHVRSHSDAFYNSKYFPYSYYISGKQGKNPGFDPLEIMCYFAKVYNLQIHAWINPFRVLQSTDLNLLSNNNPAKKYIKAKNDYVKKVSTGYYYNPCIKEVQNLIVNGVKEIVQKYDVDGIHFDDYFYPTTSSSFDKSEYKSYCKSTKTPVSQSEWRRNNINNLIKKVYKVVHKYNKIFGVSPHCSLYYNYYQQYADLKNWCISKCFIDYIAPQIYYGFDCKEVTPDGQSLEFKKCADFWQQLVGDKVDVYIGLALYLCGEDGEWSKSRNIILRQAKYINSIKDMDGIIVFSYSYFTANKYSKSEIKSLSKYLN